MTTKSSGLFHAVRRATTYAIYANDEPFLVPTKATKLSRREAAWIATALNEKTSAVNRGGVA